MHSELASKQLELNYDLIENYIGSHARTENFQFQEKMRMIDLAVRDIFLNMNKEYGKQLFTQGWCQILAAVYLLNEDKETCKISDAFRSFVKKELSVALEKCETDILVKENVRAQTKNIMMYPHPGEYYDWKGIDTTEVIETEIGRKKVSVELLSPYLNSLNSSLKETSPRYSLHEGKLYLNLYNSEDEATIFDKLWASDFSAAVDKLGFKEMKANNEHPHITLVNSNVISEIRDEFIKKYKEEGEEKFTVFMNQLVKSMNDDISEKSLDCKFEKFLKTYSEEVTYFSYCVVADLAAPYVASDLRYFISKVEEEFTLGKDVVYSPKIRVKSSFHLTVGVEYRKSAEWPATSDDVKLMLSQRNEMMEKLAPHFRGILV